MTEGQGEMGKKSETECGKGHFSLLSASLFFL